MSPYHPMQPLTYDFDEPRFTTQELLACVPGLTHDLYKQWLRRGLMLTTEMSRGRRPLHRGSDVVKVGLRHQLSPHGIFFAKFEPIWLLVRGRVIAHQTGLAGHTPGAVSFLFHIAPRSGDLMHLAFSEDGTKNPPDLDDPSVPDTHLLLRVDRFIVRMVDRMTKVKAGTPVDQPPTTAEAETWAGDWDIDEAGRRVLVGLTRGETEELGNLASRVLLEVASPEERERCDQLDVKHHMGKYDRLDRTESNPSAEDFFRTWTNDEQGRRVLVGLNFDESQWYRAYQRKSHEHRLNDRYFPWRSLDEHHAEKDRWLALHNKREAARLRRIGDEAMQRQKDQEK